VKHKINGQKGEVIEIKKDKVLVVFGVIKMWIPKAELESTQEGNSTNIQQKTTGFNWVERQSAYNTSIDLHGLRAEQSIEVITKWMDEGYALGHKRLKIIHGRGTGALRKAIRLHLKSVNYVKSYENERSDMGGDGCTIIVLN
jgi:DNA mismatch repair protein MutS2